MRSPYGYCCLGVLEILEEDPFGAIDGNTGDTGTTSTLVRMNDDEKKSFLEIADWIVENVKVSHG